MTYTLYACLALHDFNSVGLELLHLGVEEISNGGDCQHRQETEPINYNRLLRAAACFGRLCQALACA
jgi:hypothetical protein